MKPLLVRILRLCNNTTVVLSLALVIGLVFGQGASLTAPAVSPALGVMMALSMMDLSPGVFRNFRGILFPAGLSIVLSYGIFGVTIIGLSNLLIPERDVWAGAVLMVAVPSAIAVLPYSYYLRGNPDLALVGVVASYAAAFIITPLVTQVFLGRTVIDTGKLLITLVQLILVPFVVAQVLKQTPAALPVRKYGGVLISLLLALIIYTGIGLNRDVFLGEPGIIWRVAVVMTGAIFGLNLVIEFAGRILGVKKEDRITYALMCNRKNNGMVIAVALTFLTVRATIPAAVSTVISVANLIWLSSWYRSVNK